MIRKAPYMATMVLLVSGGLRGQARPNCAVVPRSLAAMRDCYRPLLVFSPSGDDGRLKCQVTLLDAGADDMMDRFVLFTPIVPDGRRVTTPVDSPYTVLEAKQMSAVRAQFHIPTGEFTILLLDEDARVLLRSGTPLAANRLNARIDQLPRRQAEKLRPHAN
ncbi:MAG TPA: DUF4174 domain-containing protein [Acidobacteriaceae bacterium]|jgi:hypothetical protein|nr:DUF4174 domain-containing protein [Acidobacteriaceae bacterium]